MEIQIAAHGLKLIQEADQILEAAAETIHRPCRDHVDLARRGILEQPVEARALVSAFMRARKVNDIKPYRPLIIVLTPPTRALTVQSLLGGRGTASP